MGWWRGARDGVSFYSEDENFHWGDEAADLMDDALRAIAEKFVDAFGREPRLEELRAGLEFSLIGGDNDESYPSLLES